MNLNKNICALILSALVANNAWALTPGGLVASYGSNSGISSSLSMSITIEKEPAVKSYYYWAEQFYLNSDTDHNGYFGIQTGGNINGIEVGKMFIFSIWNAVDAEAGPGAVAQTFDGEGIGYSVRKAVSWKEGVPYTFNLLKDGDFWWKLYFSAPGQNAEYLGRIKITENVKIENGFLSFTEYFGELNSCDDLPYVKTSFSDVSFDNTIVPAYEFNNYGLCESKANGSLSLGMAIHEVGINSECDLDGDGAVNQIDQKLKIQILKNEYKNAYEDWLDFCSK